MASPAGERQAQFQLPGFIVLWYQRLVILLLSVAFTSKGCNLNPTPVTPSVRSSLLWFTVSASRPYAYVPPRGDVEHAACPIFLLNDFTSSSYIVVTKHFILRYDAPSHMPSFTCEGEKVTREAGPSAAGWLSRELDA